MRVLTFLARRFVAGEKVEDAIKAVRKLNSDGITATIDILGENVRNKDEAIRAADEYVSLLEVIKQTGVDSGVSLKLTQMGLDISPEFCAENVERILRKAKETNNFVRIDMEGSPYTQKTLDIFQTLSNGYKNVGCVIQAYLFRSKDDITGLNKMKAQVRLCKGAYKEPKTIAFKNKRDVNKSFVELTEMLLTDGNYPAIATHDQKIIDTTKEFARQDGIDRDRFEFQMLYGIRRKSQKQLANQGYNMRVYVPYGTHWLPYFIRRLRERKENVFFVLKNLFRA